MAIHGATGLLLVIVLAGGLSSGQEYICDKPADIVFVMDGSESLSRMDFIKMLKFITDLVEKFKAAVDSRQYRLGVVVFSTGIDDVLPINDYTNYFDFVRKIVALQRSYGTTSTNVALSRMRQEFQNNGRADTKWMGIVITDGRSANPIRTQAQAQAAKADGIDMMAIGYGNNIFNDELLNIASSPSKVFRSSDFAELVDIVYPPLRRAICEAPDTTTPSNSPLCPDCMIDAHYGFLTYEGFCEKYIQVYTDVSGDRKTITRRCKPGLFWDEYVMTCRRPQTVSCQYDPCINLTAGTTYHIDDLCSGYMMCVQGRSHRACCDFGHRYVPGTGCQDDSSCVDTCEGDNEDRINHGSACRFSAVATDDTKYIETVPGHGDILRPCAPGTQFRQSTCSCSVISDVPPGSRITRCTADANFDFNTGFTDGSGRRLSVGSRGVTLQGGRASFSMQGAQGIQTSMVNMYRFAGVDFRSSLVISTHFQSAGVGSPVQALVTNCLFSTEEAASISIKIVLATRAVVMTAVTSSGTAEVILPFQLNQMNELVYIYDGENLTGVVNGEKRQAELHGELEIRKSGIILGAGSQIGPFEGTIDEFQLFMCMPDFAKDLVKP